MTDDEIDDWLRAHAASAQPDPRLVRRLVDRARPRRAWWERPALIGAAALVALLVIAGRAPAPPADSPAAAPLAGQVILTLDGVQRGAFPAIGDEVDLLATWSSPADTRTVVQALTILARDPVRVALFPHPAEIVLRLEGEPTFAVARRLDGGAREVMVRAPAAPLGAALATVDGVAPFPVEVEARAGGDVLVRTDPFHAEHLVYGDLLHRLTIVAPTER